MSDGNYKDKLNRSEYLSDRLKQKKELIEDLEKKAKKQKKKLSKELNRLSNSEVEAMFLTYIPLNKSLFI